ncbi:MAG: plastocyanin/azurin family copper-binding protein, partial [Myxococcota bacterium]
CFEVPGQARQIALLDSAKFGEDIGQTSVTVTIASLSYDPATVNLQQGGSVTWVNNGNQQHVVRCRNDSGTEVFDELLEANGTYTHTFDMAGTYTIDDRLFSDFATLRGTIIVN